MIVNGVIALKKIKNMYKMKKTLLIITAVIMFVSCREIKKTEITKTALRINLDSLEMGATMRSHMMLISKDSLLVIYVPDMRKADTFICQDSAEAIRMIVKAVDQSNSLISELIERPPVHDTVFLPERNIKEGKWSLKIDSTPIVLSDIKSGEYTSSSRFFLVSWKNGEYNCGRTGFITSGAYVNSDACDIYLHKVTGLEGTFVIDNIIEFKNRQEYFDFFERKVISRF